MNRRTFVRTSAVAGVGLATSGWRHGVHPRRRSDVVLRGGTVFDANGDGRLDLFLPYAQRTFGKQTTENGLLTDEDMPAWPNVLFLNQGNDEKGDPIFVSVQELLANGNKQLEKEELLIEGKYQPRNSVDDDELGLGRIGWGAVSADFNGDGLVDLYLLNGHFGIMIQNQEVGFPVYPAPRSLGREARREPVIMQMYPFIRHELEDGLTATVDYGTGSEPDGRNTLYLNMGVDAPHRGKYFDTDSAESYTVSSAGPNAVTVPRFSTQQ